MKSFTVLALSGSLRAASLNTAMLRMAEACALPGLSVNLHRGLGALPLFNPDLEANEPESVGLLRQEIVSADAILIASPEYAHGVSGVMKNALDWMVASGVFVDKPVVLWNASPRASHALAALRETLTVMSSRLVAAASLALLIKRAEPGQVMVNPDPASMVRALRALRAALCLTPLRIDSPERVSNRGLRGARLEPCPSSHTRSEPTHHDCPDDVRIT